MMKHPSPLLCLLTLFLCSATPVLAQYEEGQKAFDSGDYAAAQAAWQKGAEANDSRSQYSLGYLAQFGMAGGVADIAAAKSWYEKAADNNNADALYALGLMYERGQAGAKDLTRAFELYQKAAGGSHADAEYAVGRMLLRGRGVARNAAESVKWLKKAAEHNNPAGQYMLASAYEAGWGVKANEGEAYYWYRRADHGDPVELEEQDVSFEPKIAIAALKKRLPADIIEDQDARLRHDLAPAKPKAKAAPVKASAPDALTKQP